MIYLYSALGLGGLAILIYVVRSIKAWGVADLKRKDAEDESKAHKIRDKVEDDISRLNSSDKRLRLNKWVRGVQTDQADKP